MSADISQIKAEIKEWQRAHRRIHGRDPGKEELRKNPDMQAKYKIWQASLKAEKEKINNASKSTTPPKRAPKSIVPKTMPTQSTAGPATPFSARKIAPKLSPASSSSSQPKIPNPFSQSPNKAPRPLDFSAAKARASSSKSTRTIPFDSASSARHRPFPVLDSDSDEDDNPFAPTSPTRSRRPSSYLVSPSKSALRRKSSGALSSRSTNMNLSPTRPKRPTAIPTMTPRTKARKRMRGEEVPTTPGDKRRKLVPAKDIDSVPPPLFGEPRGTKRQSSDNDNDDDEIMDSPRKKSAIGANGRVFTSVFDDSAGDGDGDDEELASPRKVAFAFSESETVDDGISRSTPPPPPSESGESQAPDEDEDPVDEDNTTPPPPASTSTSRGKPLNPIIPGRWTQDKWDAPAPGTDLSHLRKGQLGKKPPTSDKSKVKAKGKSKPDEGQPALHRIANPFELLPPIPGDEPAPKNPRQADGKFKGKDGKSAAEMKKRTKEVAAEVEMEQNESSDVDEQVQEIAWRPHGPLRATTPSVPLPSSNPAANDNKEELEQADLAQHLPSDLRTLLSIRSSRQDDLKQEALARDLLAGRARASTAVEVWGVGDLGDWEGEEGEGEEGDWESEPEGWTGGVEM